MTKLRLLTLGLGVLLSTAVAAQKPTSTPKKQVPRKVEICHHAKAGTKTLRVAESDVSAHLAHGDTQGSCPIH